MNKLPIGTAVIDSVKFGFNNMFTTIRLGWVGFLLFIAIIIVAGVLCATSVDFSAFEALDEGDFDDEMEALHAIFSIYGLVIGAILLASIAFIPVTVMLTKMAANDVPAPPGIGYFKIGGTEILYFLGGILLCILFSIVAVISFLPAILSFSWGVVSGMAGGENMHDMEALESMLESSSFGLGGALGILLIVVGIVLIIWFALRTITFMPAIAAEDSLPLFRALKMTGGNVWHILGAIILFFLLLYAIEIGITIVCVVVFLVGAFLFQAAAAASEILGFLVIGLGVFAAFFAILLYIMFLIAAEVAFPAQIYKHLKDNA